MVDQRRWTVLVLCATIGCADAGREGERDFGAGGDGHPATGDLASNLSALDAAGADLSAIDAAMSVDFAITGKETGESCGGDGECVSHLCRPVVALGSKVCVSDCTGQADCARFASTFCAPITVGGATGYCIPQSPSHCATCSTDSDCGSLTERCVRTPQDVAPACHIDCSLSGQEGCPADYVCSVVDDSGMNRMLCVPRSGVCLDAIGGFCDRVTLPQSCARTNGAGTCAGQRACLGAARRYDRCDAIAPQYKSCGTFDPAGCQLLYAPDAMSQPDHCGACGAACASVANGTRGCSSARCTIASCDAPYRDCNARVDDGCEVNTLTDPDHCGGCNLACPSVASGARACVNGACGVGSCSGEYRDCNGQPSDGCEVNVSAAVSHCGACGVACPGLGLALSQVDCIDHRCTLTCRGDNYDVDGSAANGCERADSDQTGHVSAAAASIGDVGNCDGGDYEARIVGHIYSDARVHQNPAVTGFSSTVGTAPDWWRAHASGGFWCQNDYSILVTTFGGGAAACYKVTFMTDKLTKSVTLNGNGTATMSGGSGSYSDDSDIYFLVEKTCSLPTKEAVTYQIDFYL